jgi:hypothetical protein
MANKTAKSRCAWAGNDALMRTYHDTEWGVPQHDSRALWELLMLEGFQAGLSWITVLRKREAFRKEFKGFDPKKVARFGEADIERLLNNPGIIRSRGLALGHHRRQADPQCRPGSCADAAVGGDVEATQEAGIQVCRPGDCVRIHAGGGNGE